MMATNETLGISGCADEVEPRGPGREGRTLTDLSDDPGFRRYVAADADRTRIAQSGSAEEIDALVAAYPAYAQAERAHCEAIAAAHPNFRELSREPAFDVFVDAVGARPIVDSGSAAEIIDLLDRYVVVRPRPEQLVSAPAAAQPRAITVDDNPRAWYALTALSGGPTRREEIDRAAGVSNGPDLIADLRRVYGLCLPCVLVDHIDRYGKKVRKGVYSLSEEDRPKVARLLRLEPSDGAEAAGPCWLHEWAASLTAEERHQWLAQHVDLPPLPVGNPFIDAALGASAGG